MQWCNPAAPHCNPSKSIKVGKCHKTTYTLLPSNVNRSELLFHRPRDELIFTRKDNIVLRGSKIVTTKSLRSRAIKFASE